MTAIVHITIETEIIIKNTFNKNDISFIVMYQNVDVISA